MIDQHELLARVASATIPLNDQDAKDDGLWVDVWTMGVGDDPWRIINALEELADADLVRFVAGPESDQDSDRLYQITREGLYKVLCR